MRHLNVAVLLSAVVLACSRPVDSPQAAYGPLDETQAAEFGKKLENALNGSNPADFDALVDVDALVGEAVHDVPMTAAERAAFVRGAEGSMRKNGALGAGLMLNGEEGVRAKFLRSHEVSGRRRVLLRILAKSGMTNYVDLVVGRSSAGEPRVLDVYSFTGGELMSESMRGVALPLLGQKRGFFDRLRGAPSPDDDTVALSKTMVDARQLIAQGKHAEALALAKKLPPKVADTRAALFLRMQAAQGTSDEEYESALDAIHRKFPKDPALTFVQVDRLVLKKQYDRAIAAIEATAAALGGDAQLDTMRANTLLLAKRTAEAKAAAQAALKAEPELETAWWALASVALEEKDHAETVRLLDEIATRFGESFPSLEVVPEFADFIQSDEYRAWRANH